MTRLRNLARALVALTALRHASPAAAQASTAQRLTSPPPAPLTLRVLFDAVRGDHPVLKAAQARIRAAEGMRATAGRLGNPMLSYQVQNTTFFAAGSVPEIDRETMEMATFPLEPLYLRSSRVARTTAEVRAASADADRERQRVALDAASAFYRVALARVTVSTNQDLVAWLDSLVAYTGARAREGAAAEADLLRSTLERDRAAAEATMAEAELAQATAQLATFLAAPGNFDASRVAPGESPLALPATTQRQAVSSSAADGQRIGLAPFDVSLRPDVRAARERENAAAAGIGTERRSLFRDMAATIGVQQMMGTNSLIAGLSLPFPLFDQNRGEVARATAERDVARFDLASQERLAQADIVGATESARLLSVRAEALARPGPDNLLLRADEMRRIAFGAYREGAVPLVQLLDAARAWGDARLTFYRILYAQHQAVLALVVATGGDLFTQPLTSTGSAR